MESCQSLMVASCQETSLCFTLLSPFPAGTSLPQREAHGDSRTAQGGSHPAQSVPPSLHRRSGTADSRHAELVTPSLYLTCSLERGCR